MLAAWPPKCPPFWSSCDLSIYETYTVVGTPMLQKNLFTYLWKSNSAKNLSVSILYCSCVTKQISVKSYFSPCFLLFDMTLCIAISCQIKQRLSGYQQQAFIQLQRSSSLVGPLYKLWQKYIELSLMVSWPDCSSFQIWF